MATRNVSDCLRTMRLALSRRNENDPDSNDTTLLQYLNDFIELTMSNDVRLFEQYGTLTFTIDESNTSGVYTFNDVGASSDFVTLSSEALVSLLDPQDNSVSWNRLRVYTDPGEFFNRWGINNDETLIQGFPTEMLFYGNEFTFRTIPNTSYQIKIFGYKENEALSSDGDPAIPYAYWMRYMSYGAAYNYAYDYNFSANHLALIERSFKREKTLLLTRTHNQRRVSRCYPKF